MLNEKTDNFVNVLFGHLINTGSDSDRKEAKALSNVIELLRPIKYIGNRGALGYVIAFFEMIFTNPLFSVHADSDPKDTSTVRLSMIYPNLTLPDKVYYTESDYEDYVDAFRTHAQNVLDTYSNLTDGVHDFLTDENAGQDVIDIETLIAQSSRTAEDKRKMDTYYSRQPYTAFIEIMGACDVQHQYNCEEAMKLWKIYFKSTYIKSRSYLQKFYPNVITKNPEEIVVYDSPYFQKITKILMTQPVKKICRYLAYHLIAGTASITIRSLDESYQQFVSLKLNGQAGPTPREDRVLRIIDSMYGEFLGKEYVKRHFDKRSKDIVAKMTDRIKSQMRKSIDTSSWMTAEKTKEEARNKLDSINVKVGYPDRYEDREYMVEGINDRLKQYTSGEKTLTDILIYTRICHFAHDIISKVDTPKNPHRWAMNPQDVNAYYSPQMNEIVFPAGILSKPIFDPDQDSAINYGRIGTVIAHEITHGFDDQGRKYDGNGNIRNWWTEDDISSFKSLAEKMIRQYERYEVEVHTDNGPTNMNVKGLLTLGENIADLGGVSLSLRAYEEELRESGKTVTPEDRRRFFDAYALLWRKKLSPAKVMTRILSDPHSPSRYRVWVIRNTDDFHDTYGIEEGHAMYLPKEERVRIY